MRKFYTFSLSAVLVFTSFLSRAQTYTGTGGIIPANGNAAYFQIEPNSLGASTLDTNFGVLNVCINISHPNDADLEVQLIAPDGTQVMLTYANGGDGNNYTNTYFDDRANPSIHNGTAPFTGSFKPEEMLGSVNNGQTGYGTWKLYVRDLYTAAYSGSLLNWSITFGTDAPGPFALTSSNLPIVMINTYGQVIPDEPKIPAGLKIYNKGPGIRNYITDTPEFDGHSGIELRGSSSQSFPKKSYGFESWDALGNSIDTSFLGMPSESDWILNANYTDKSLMRNVMAYQVWQNMGHYATRYHFVELMLNGHYMGVYIFSEKIKRNKNRVDIAKLKIDQNTGDEVTGGYIIKIDKQTGSGGSGWTSSYAPSASPNGQTIFYQYEYPKEEDITVSQQNYIKNYVYSFETALKGSSFADTTNGYRKYAVESTFSDYFLVNEITKNVDGYRLSTFMSKERESRGGKIRMGPVWDYDIAWHNADYCGGDVTSGWAYQFPCPDDYWQVPFWWSRLLQDPLYKSHLKCRWLYLRQNVLSNAWFDNYIDSISGQLMEAQVRNFTAWPILGVYVWPNPWPYAPTYEGEVSGLKTWIHSRLSWLDTNMPGTCETTFDVNYPEAINTFGIYPNPVSDKLNVEYQTVKKTMVEITIINQQGAALYFTNTMTKSPGEWLETIDLSTYAPGVYLVRLTLDGKSYSKRFIKT
ncbi:MAG: CotH kinase family protein [Bacteroidota bacterium]